MSRGNVRERGSAWSMKMWAGRFEKEADSRVNDFNSSIRFDSRMFREDLAGSVAHAAMLAAQGIITGSECEQIARGLGEILEDLTAGKLAFDPAAEDIHMFVEQELTRRIGEAGKRLHTARSRNDQVALDLRLYLRRELAEIRGLLAELLETLLELAERHMETIMPGYTHLQRGQPVTFAHHLLAYVQMLLRDCGRLADAGRRMEECPLGCGALAGTTHPIDRFATAKALGFDRPMENSLDGVSDRDYAVEIAGALSLLMVHLSRLSEEVILWCSWEFRFITLDDAFATGSSIMPQKKNPDVTELIRGKAGRVFGDLLGLLTMLKGLPLAYNKDMQEDKEAIFDAVDTVKLCLRTFTPMMSGITVHKDNMRKAAAEGFLNATDCADYLVRQGLPFRTAYKVTGELVARCIREGRTLESLPFGAYKEAHEAFGKDVYEAVSLDRCVEGRTSYGGPAPAAVRGQWERARVAVERLRTEGEKVSG